MATIRTSYEFEGETIYTNVHKKYTGDGIRIDIHKRKADDRVDEMHVDVGLSSARSMFRSLGRAIHAMDKGAAMSDLKSLGQEDFDLIIMVTHKETEEV